MKNMTKTDEAVVRLMLEAITWVTGGLAVAFLLGMAIARGQWRPLMWPIALIAVLVAIKLNGKRQA